MTHRNLTLYRGSVSLLILALLSVSASALAAEPPLLRSWRLKDGQLFAEKSYLSEVGDGRVVVLRNLKGSSKQGVVDQLSDEDQKYITEWLKAPAADPHIGKYRLPQDEPLAPLRDWTVDKHIMRSGRVTELADGVVTISLPGKEDISVLLIHVSEEDFEHIWAWRNGKLPKKTAEQREAQFAQLLKAAEPPRAQLTREIMHTKVGDDDTDAAHCDAVFFSHDSRLLIVSDDTRINRVYDTQDWQQIATFESDPEVKTFAVSHDGKHVAAAGVEKDVHVWELATGKLVHTHETTGLVSHVLLHPQHPFAVVALQDGKLFSVPLLGGERVDLRPPRGTLNFRWLAQAGPTWQSLTWFQHNEFCAGLRTDCDRILCFLLDREGKHRETYHYHFHYGKNDPQLLSHGNEELVASPGTLGLEIGKSYWDTLSTNRTPMSFVAVDDVILTAHESSVPDSYVYQLAAKEGFLEIRRTQHHGLPLYVRLGEEDYEGGALSNNGKHVACIRKNGSVAVFGIDQFADPPQWKIGESLYNWVEANDFAGLNAFAEYVASHDETCSWDRSETLYDYLCSAVIQDRGPPRPPAGYRERLERLLRANPDSDFSRIVRAKLRIGEGWDARGDGYAASVTAKGWEEFTKALIDARELLEPVMVKENPPSHCYTLWLLVARADSIDDERVQKVLERLLEKHPTLTGAHVERATALMPRWGGQPGDAEAYAAKVADHIGGRDGDLMYARIASALVPYYWDHFFEAEQFDYERIQSGLGHLRKVAPQDPFGYHAALRFATLAPAHREHAAWFVRKIETTGIAPERSLWLNPRHYASIRKQLLEEPMGDEGSVTEEK